jgi:hypothetical protein
VGVDACGKSSRSTWIRDGDSPSNPAGSSGGGSRGGTEITAGGASGGIETGIGWLARACDDGFAALAGTFTIGIRATAAVVFSGPRPLGSGGGTTGGSRGGTLGLGGGPGGGVSAADSSRSSRSIVISDIDWSRSDDERSGGIRASGRSTGACGIGRMPEPTSISSSSSDARYASTRDARLPRAGAAGVPSAPGSSSGGDPKLTRRSLVLSEVSTQAAVIPRSWELV